jgi:hypothetical protein
MFWRLAKDRFGVMIARRQMMVKVDVAIVLESGFDAIGWSVTIKVPDGPQHWRGPTGNSCVLCQTGLPWWHYFAYIKDVAKRWYRLSTHTLHHTR